MYATPSRERASYCGVLERVVAWLRTIDKLTQPADIQAMSACARSMFEIVVDLTLLALDPAENSHEKLETWERSAHLHNAERTKRFLEGQPAPRVFAPALKFIAERRAEIVADRMRLWGSSRHQPRWTGRAFDQDVVEADRLLGVRQFQYLHTGTFAHLCWNTHGSALAGLRAFDQTGVAALVGVALGMTAEFAQRAAMLVLRLYNVPAADTDAHFDRLTANRAVLRTSVLGEFGVT
jgi:hypothetical protein